jgi:hypothetical protein
MVKELNSETKTVSVKKSYLGGSFSYTGQLYLLVRNFLAL